MKEEISLFIYFTIFSNRTSTFLAILIAPPVAVRLAVFLFFLFFLFFFCLLCYPEVATSGLWIGGKREVFSLCTWLVTHFSFLLNAPVLVSVCGGAVFHDFSLPSHPLLQHDPVLFHCSSSC